MMCGGEKQALRAFVEDVRRRKRSRRKDEVKRVVAKSGGYFHRQAR